MSELNSFAAARALRRSSLLAFLFAVLWVGCDATEESGDTTVVGRVVNALDPTQPIEGALVTIVERGATVVTDAAGEFDVVVEADSTGQEFSLSVTKEGFETTTRSFEARVGEIVDVFDIPLTAGDGSGGPTGPAGPPSSITLAARSSETIGVSGAGADETATLTFVVLDGRGRPVSDVELNFEIANGPGEGVQIDPTMATTNVSGEAQVTVTSGTRSGTVQVAAFTTVDGRTLRSEPVTITITGGLPDAAHFSVAPEALNFPGYTRFGLINPVTAFVGDIYANPVQPGTAVYFTTNAGIIEGSGVTDALGRTTVQLISAAPLTTGDPPAACPSSNPTGYAQVTARTSDMNQQTIEAQTPVLFSGDSDIDLLTVDADVNGLGSYTYFVGDPFGHPLAPGTTISVVADGVNVEAVGDINVELGDHLCPGPGRTEFAFGVVLGDEEGEDDLPVPPELETITINVRSTNGNIQLTVFNEGGNLRTEVERLDI